MLYILYILFTKHKLTFRWLCIDRKRMCPYIEPLIPKFLAFCYWHSLLLIGRLVVQFGGYRARNIIREFKIYDATVAKTSLKIASSSFSIYFAIMSVCLTFEN